MPPTHEITTYAFSLENLRKDRHGEEKSLSQTISETASGLATLGTECNKAPFAERITTRPNKLSEFAKLIEEDDFSSENIATGRIYEWAKETKPSIQIWTTSPLNTEEILESMRRYIDFNPKFSMVWISPSLSGVYPESRINWYQIIEVNKEIYIFGRFLCSNHSPQECVEMAKKLLPYSSGISLAEINDPELLRATPLPITIPGNSPINFFKEIVNIPGVWEAISLGRDIDDNKLTTRVAEDMGRKWGKLVATADTPCKQRMIGAAIEEELAQRLERELMAGHGPLYSQAINQLASHEGFGFLLEKQIIESKEKRHCGACPDKGTEKFKPEEVCRKKSSD